SFGTGILGANPVPHTETVNALRFHFRNWVMKDIAPPASKYPTLAGGFLVDPAKAAMGFPTIPGLPADAPTGLINAGLDYDWGPEFNYVDGSGVRSKIPPAIKHVLKMKVPRTDADGNELGGVPVVLRDAPLGTYLGWNIVASGVPRDAAGALVRAGFPTSTTEDLALNPRLWETSAPTGVSTMSVFTLKVNGQSHTLDVDPTTPLFYVLSDDLALNGPKFG